MDNQLRIHLREALKKGEKLKVSVLRMLMAAVHNAEIEKRGELTTAEFQTVVRKEVEKRKEAIDAYRQAKRADRVEQEEQEAKILKNYLPEELSESKLNTIIEQIISKHDQVSENDFGKIMGEVMAQVAGRADGNRVKVAVKEKIKNT